MKFDINKAKEMVGFTLDKKGIRDVKAAVVLNLDVSGSARNLFNSGAIQAAFETIVPLAMTFDDNESLQVFTFADGTNTVSEIQPDATAANFDGYIDKNILNNNKVPKWGGTYYSPVLRKNLENLGFIETKKGLFGSKTNFKKDNGSGFPAFILTFTDGANQDQSETRKLLKEAQDSGVQAYFMFVGIGDPNYFTNIVDLGEEFDNVGFVSVEDLNKFIGSEEIYDQLLCDELVEWFKK